jgi:hypothetical protein
MRQPIFADYLKCVYPSRTITDIKPDEALYFLDDLAERRNEVAHGMPGDLLSNAILLEYIAFLEAYGRALYEAIRADALAFAILRSIPLGSAIAVYNKSIVCFSITKLTVSQGDLLLAKTKDKHNPQLCSPIVELQANKKTFSDVTAKRTRKIAARVTFRAKMNHNFHLIPKEFAFD